MAAKMSARALRARDAKRDIGAELLASVREMKAGKVGDVHRIPASTVAEARTRTGLSQPQFAELLGVSARTLQEWEQGRRNPSGAARTLLRIAHRRPEAILEAIGSADEADRGGSSRTMRKSDAGGRAAIRASARKG